jgi:hypothetical protein
MKLMKIKQMKIKMKQLLKKIKQMKIKMTHTTLDAQPSPPDLELFETKDSKSTIFKSYFKVNETKKFHWNKIKKNNFKKTIFYKKKIFENSKNIQLNQDELKFIWKYFN